MQEAQRCSLLYLVWRRGGKSGTKRLLSFLTILIVSCFPCQGTTANDDELNEQRVASASPQGFTALDAICMTRIIDPDERRSAYLNVSPKFNFSHDGRHFVIVTNRGNVKTGYNETKLIIYETNDVLNFINENATKSENRLPDQEVLVRFDHASNQKGVEQVRWSDDNRILYFIAISDGGADSENRAGRASQVYSIDIHSKKLLRLTNHPRSVTNFDISPTGRIIIYASTVPSYSDARGRSHYQIGKRSIYEVININKEVEHKRRAQYYALDLSEQDPARALGQPFTKYAPDAWLSPDGRWAIGMLMPAKNRPDWFENYLPLAQIGYPEFDEHTMADAPRVFWQFALIDLQKGTIRPLLDAPNGQFFGGGQVDVRWLPDGKSVILANTFLPLNVLDPQELLRRRQSPATVEYDIKTQQVTRIIEHTVPAHQYRASEWYSGMSLTDDGMLTIKRMISAREERKALPDKTFKRNKDGWVEIKDSAPSTRTATHQLTLSIRQDLNTSPDIIARDTRTGRERLITDLNPQFRELTFGKTAVFEWTDETGADQFGGLVYPPDYRPGKRYPVVIQTHGFQKDHFLVEGPPGLTSAYAAQALANKGIMVLQLPDSTFGPQRRETDRLRIEGAIDALDEMGLVHRQKVGLIGFSATGHIVQHLITFSEYEFAAVTIADAFSLSFMGYVQLFGFAPPNTMASREARLQAVPWGDGIIDWVANSPVFHLDRVKTPLRLEKYSAVQLGWWDIYAILRRQRKPVEFIVIADGRHNLVKSLERYVIQQGNVDWFDFWLNGRERSEPYPGTPETKESLAEQYERWRKLKQLQEKSETEAINARAWHKEEAARQQAAAEWLQSKEGKRAAAALLEPANDQDVAVGRTGTND